MRVLNIVERKYESARASKSSFLLLPVTEVIYFIGLAAYLLNYILLSTTQLNGPSGLINLFVLGVVLVKILLTSVELDVKVLSAVTVIAIGVLTWSVSGASQLLIVVAFVLGSRGVSSKRIALVAFYTIALGVLFVCALCAFGYLPNSVYIDAARTRHTIGFSYLGMFDLYVLHLALLAIYLKGSSLKLPIVLLFLTLHCFAFSQSVVRGTMIVSLMVWALYFLFIKRKPGIFLLRALGIVAVSAIPLCLLFAVYTAVCYQPGSASWAVVDELFSGRLGLTQKALDTYGFMPFGQTVTWVGRAAVRSGQYSFSQYNYVDSGYLQLLIQFGYFALIVVCAAYIVTAWLAFKKRTGIAIEIWVVAVAVECLIYPNLLLLAYNCLLLIALNDVFSGEKGRAAGE